MKVLVLAGDARQRDLIQSALERSKHEVFSAATAGEALGLVDSAHPRLAILDEDLTTGARDKFVTRIRRSGPPLYLIALTTAVQPVADFDDTLRKPFTASDVAARVSIAQRVLELGDSLSEAREQMDNLSLYDPLTGLMNANAFYRTARGELERARRTAAPFSIISLDLDNFTDLNAAYGFSAGDEALKAVATTIRERSRPYDCLGRWNGDEFILALAGVIGEDAEKIAQRIIKGVALSDIVYEGQRLSVGLSAGVASILQIHASTEVQPLIDQARQARARAKEMGGNQVFVIFS